jgi:hypothetical protein
MCTAVLCSVRYSKRLESETSVSGNEMMSPVGKGGLNKIGLVIQTLNSV